MPRKAPINENSTYEDVLRSLKKQELHDAITALRLKYGFDKPYSKSLTKAKLLEYWSLSLIEHGKDILNGWRMAKTRYVAKPTRSTPTRKAKPTSISPEDEKKIIAIQALIRGRKARKDFADKKKIVALQSLIRGRRVQKDYNELKDTLQELKKTTAKIEREHGVQLNKGHDERVREFTERVARKKIGNAILKYNAKKKANTLILPIPKVVAPPPPIYPGSEEAQFEALGRKAIVKMHIKYTPQEIQELSHIIDQIDALGKSQDEPSWRKEAWGKRLSLMFNVLGHSNLSSDEKQQINMEFVKKYNPFQTVAKPKKVRKQSTKK